LNGQQIPYRDVRWFFVYGQRKHERSRSRQEAQEMSIPGFGCTATVVAAAVSQSSRKSFPGKHCMTGQAEGVDESIVVAAAGRSRLAQAIGSLDLADSLVAAQMDKVRVMVPAHLRR
jgi:hypothetical protein